MDDKMTKTDYLYKATGLLVVLIVAFLIALNLPFSLLSFLYFGTFVSIFGVLLISVGYSVYRRRVSLFAFGILSILMGLFLIFIGISINEGGLNNVTCGLGSANCNAFVTPQEQLWAIMTWLLAVAFIIMGAELARHSWRRRKSSSMRKRSRVLGEGMTETDYLSRSAGALVVLLGASVLIMIPVFYLPLSCPSAGYIYTPVRINCAYFSPSLTAALAEQMPFLAAGLLLLPAGYSIFRQRIDGWRFVWILLPICLALIVSGILVL